MCPVTAVLVKVTSAQGVTPVDVSAFRGEQVTFNCSGSDVVWTLGTKKIFSSTLSDPWNTPKGNKYDIVGNYYLVVKNLDSSSDGGTYRCNTDEISENLVSANLVVFGKFS